MLAFSLQSGSNGNSIYVEADGVGVLFDAGISGKLAAERMAACGRDIRRVRALVLSHEHADHVSGAGVFQRKFGLPIWCTRKTYRRTNGALGSVDDVRFFTSGDCLDFGPLRVRTVRTPHDAADPICFVVEHDGRRLAILTDLGHPFRELATILAESDAAFLESNYDPDMLAGGPYSEALKARIRGDRGHLSNDESALLLLRPARGRLRWVSLAHLSEVNNEPDLAISAHRSRVGRQFPIFVASRYAVGEPLEV